MIITTCLSAEHWSSLSKLCSAKLRVCNAIYKWLPLTRELSNAVRLRERLSKQINLSLPPSLPTANPPPSSEGGEITLFILFNKLKITNKKRELTPAFCVISFLFSFYQSRILLNPMLQHLILPQQFLQLFLQLMFFLQSELLVHLLFFLLYSQQTLSSQ